MSRPLQLSLFEMRTFNVTADQKAAMNEAVKACGLSRAQVVDKMNDLAGRYGVCLVNGRNSSLTVEVFEKWINPNDSTRVMPIKALPIFCAAVGDASAFTPLLAPLGMAVIGPDEQKLLRWAKIKLRQKVEAGELRQIEKEIL